MCNYIISMRRSAQNAYVPGTLPGAWHVGTAIFRADAHAVCGATVDENLTAEGAEIAEAFRFSAPSASSAVIFRAGLQIGRGAYS